MTKKASKSNASKSNASKSNVSKSNVSGRRKISDNPEVIKVSRPKMPKSYGIKESKNPEDYRPWSYLEKRMKEARNYWVATSRPDGRPHVMPVWGIWVEGRFYFGTASDSRKARNLAENPAIAVHLESGDDVIILEGVVEQRMPDEVLREKMNAESLAKYQMPLMLPPGAAMYMLKPRVAFAWSESNFSKTATRWILDLEAA